jgi:hypothetical protein
VQKACPRFKESWFISVGGDCVWKKNVRVFFCVQVGERIFFFCYVLLSFFSLASPYLCVETPLLFIGKTFYIFLPIAWSHANLVTKQSKITLVPHLFFALLVPCPNVFCFSYFFVFWFIFFKKNNVNINSMRKINQ